MPTKVAFLNTDQHVAVCPNCSAVMVYEESDLKVLNSFGTAIGFDCTICACSIDVTLKRADSLSRPVFHLRPLNTIDDRTRFGYHDS